MANNREEVLKFLSDTQSHWSTYHNHKETSAWAGLVLYVFLLGQIINAVDKGIASSCAIKTATILVILVSGIIICIYLYEQFSLRKRGADFVAACFYLESQFLSNPEQQPKSSDFVPPSSEDKRLQSSYCLPEIVLSTADKMASKGQGARSKLEYCAYGLVLVISLLALVRIWFMAAS
jgi:hypothetical protein